MNSGPVPAAAPARPATAGQPSRSRAAALLTAAAPVAIAVVALAAAPFAATSFAAASFAATSFAATAGARAGPPHTGATFVAGQCHVTDRPGALDTMKFPDCAGD